MILLTTPDYLPMLGGLTSLTLNLEKVLRSLGLEYELFHWKNYKQVYSFDRSKLDGYELIINIHSGFHMYMPQSKTKVINFICGAEILFYSENFLKRLLKNLTRKRSLSRIEAAHFNIFISEFTFKTLQRKGLTPDYCRDLVYHMVVDTNEHRSVAKDWIEGPLTFICVARDVPHKNFQGVVNFCETVQAILGREVELLTVTNKEFLSSKIKITSFINPSNSVRDELLARAHVNLLLSLDQSNRGFFEGFGQIVQEAGCFETPSLVLGTGGLPESVHHGETGWVLKDLAKETIEAWLSTMSPESYREISRKAYDHTVEAHGLEMWKRLFGCLAVNRA